MPTPNNSSHKYTPEEIQIYLSQLQHQSTMAFIPALVYLCILIVVGSVGNCLVLAIYSSKMTKTPLRIFIITMATFDLLTNLLVIPGEIFDMLNVWDFDIPNLCKIRRYLNAAIVISSGFVLVAVAATRYKMVCKPLGKQISITQAKLTSGVLAIIAFIIALPYGIIHGTQTIRTPNSDIFGHFCGVDDSFLKTIWPNVNSALFLLTFVICCLTMTVCYACIGHKTWKHSRNRKNLMPIDMVRKFKKTSISVSSVLDSKNACYNSHGMRKISYIGEQTLTTSESDFVDSIKCENLEKISAPHLTCSRTKNLSHASSFNSSDVTPAGNERQTSFVVTSTGNDEQKNSDVTRSFRLKAIKGPRTLFEKTTWMMFAVSLFFFFGFVPFIALNFYRTSLPESYAALEGVPLAVYHLFLRSHYINSAINPIVYSLLDQKFQSKCSELIHC